MFSGKASRVLSLLAIIAVAVGAAVLWLFLRPATSLLPSWHVLMKSTPDGRPSYESCRFSDRVMLSDVYAMQKINYEGNDDLGVIDKIQNSRIDVLKQYLTRTTALPNVDRLIRISGNVVVAYDPLDNVIVYDVFGDRQYIVYLR